MMMPRPTAASGANMGAMPENPGNTSPRAPASSLIPMNVTRPLDRSSSRPAVSLYFRYANSFMPPAPRNAMHKTSWTIQSAVFMKALLGFLDLYLKRHSAGIAAELDAVFRHHALVSQRER